MGWISLLATKFLVPEKKCKRVSEIEMMHDDAKIQKKNMFGMVYCSLMFNWRFDLDSETKIQKSWGWINELYSVPEFFVLKLAKYRRSWLVKIALVFALNKELVDWGRFNIASASNFGTISTQLGQSGSATHCYFVIDNQLRNNLSCQYSTS